MPMRLRAPRGMHLITVFNRLGITEQMKQKTKAQANASLVLESVAKGEAELAFAVSNNILSVKGVEVVALFPEELQYWVVTTLGIATRASQPEAARALVSHLTSPVAAAVLKANGLELATR